MSDKRSASHRTLETAMTAFKDPRLEVHHPVPSQPKEIVAMRHLARYEHPDDDGVKFSSTMSVLPPCAQHRRAPDHGEPPAAGYFANDFSWRAEFGARPDWCPGQDPEPEPEHDTMETSSAQQPLTPDPDLFDGLYGVTEHPKRTDSAAYVSQSHHHHHPQPQLEHERPQAYAYDGQGHGASQAYAYAGQAHGASQGHPHHHLSEPPSSYGLREAYLAQEAEPAAAEQQHHYEYRPSYSDGDYECFYFARRSSAAPPAAATTTTTTSHQQHARHNGTSRHQPSNSLVLRNVHEQNRLSPFEWRVFNQSRIHEDE
ncbi:hypothetical protein IWX90DRAFT_321447 [Phyllosticta citrichinensis]|uniref:Uncharacterized protein n=1 Tax=Phyllosticta citrichinensis TaxID=1130410 RepID=A0ABR1XJP0_9PEZI